MFTLATTALFSPLIGFCVVGGASQYLSDRLAAFLSLFFMTLCLLAGILVFHETCIVGTRYYVSLAPFITFGSTYLGWDIYLDTLSGLMVGIVSSISFLVHLYSVGYMKGETGVPRFMSYLSLFTFFMLLLVTSSHLLQLFVGWEGVGLVSYLLVGFYYTKTSACSAAVKSFLVNRVGDVGYILGLCLTFWALGSLHFAEFLPLAPKLAHLTLVLPGIGEVPVMSAIALLFFIGAMAKSAQLGLHTWLPDAMEGPTPVSALIHAATMVTAGVFLMVRLGPILELAPAIQTFIMLLGAATAFVASTIGCVQQDIKRVIAYSTCSQLGYMFMAVGCSAYGAAIFHLTTHAFFKALLFLSAGSIIHAFSGIQDMREMGGCWRFIPRTYSFMWIGSLSLAGLPFFSGFYSKDSILALLEHSAQPYSLIAWTAGIVSVFLTAFYTWRALIKTFHGKMRASSMVAAHVHESPWTMQAPLLVLAAGALLVGKLGLESFVGENTFWHGALLTVRTLPHEGWFALLLPVAISLGGIALAWVMYYRFTQLPEQISRFFSWIYKLLCHKWFFDEAYHYLFVLPTSYLATLCWKWFDVRFIDKISVEGPGQLLLWIGQRVLILQTGYIQHYAFAMLIGAACLLLFLWRLT